jgi:hypothetical protein
MDGRTASVLALSLVGLGASAAQTATAARTAARRQRSENATGVRCGCVAWASDQKEGVRWRKVTESRRSLAEKDDIAPRSYIMEERKGQGAKPKTVKTASPPLPAPHKRLRKFTELHPKTVSELDFLRAR